MSIQSAASNLRDAVEDLLSQIESLIDKPLLCHRLKEEDCQKMHVINRLNDLRHAINGIAEADLVPADDGQAGVTDYYHIDHWATLGFQFAQRGCTGMPALDYSDDMQLLAFNAGISNYNIRYGTTHPKYLPISSCIRQSELDNNPYPAGYMSVQQASI